ncbi:MAG TPA: LptE family protein [Bacteroidota bacterium]|nr:LptE family protein [Bacteroidota bacterium]
MLKTIRFTLLALLGVGLVVLLNACVYSFRGGSVPAHLNTIAIPIVEDQSGFGDPTLRDMVTSELVQRFINDNSLQMADRGTADSVLEGVITQVKPDQPVSVTAGDQVARRRITVTMRVRFQDLKQRKTVWEREFTQYGDYPSGGGLTQRTEGLREAVRKLTEDILNETVAGW